MTLYIEIERCPVPDNDYPNGLSYQSCFNRNSENVIKADFYLKIITDALRHHDYFLT